MILKGSQRRGANDLALHLSNEVDNEKVTVADIRGMVADNIYDGFREWELICDQTQAKDPFYSLSINPDPNQRDWTEEEWLEAIAHIEEKLGLTGQPRAIIFHEKEGEDGKIRKHSHVVWSRIKYENGQFKAVHMSNDYYKLKTCARELAKKFGLDLPAGLKADHKNKKEKHSKSEHNYDHAKSHGKGRDPQSVKERKELITKLWEKSENAEQFCALMRQAGYVIGQGNRRAFVLVDRSSGVHSLARQIAGVSTRELKDRLGNADAYPSVEQAMDELNHNRCDKSSSEKRTSQEQKDSEKNKAKRLDLTKEQRLMQKLRRMARRADQVNAQRQKKLKGESKDTAIRQTQETESLKRQQRVHEAKILRARYNKKPEGTLKALRVIFGYEMLLRWKHHQEDRKRQKRYVRQRKLMSKRHKAERHRLVRKAERLRKQEVREAQTLNRYCKRLGKGSESLRAQNKEKQQAQHMRFGYS